MAANDRPPPLAIWFFVLLVAGALTLAVLAYSYFVLGSPFAILA